MHAGAVPAGRAAGHRKMIQMKKAEICSVTRPGESGYLWRWQEVGGPGKSTDMFEFYFDCVTDAQNKGFVAELTHAQGETAPGGARLNLHSMTDGEQS